MALPGSARGREALRRRCPPLALLGDLHAVGQALGHPVTRPRDAHDATGARGTGSVDDPLDHGLPQTRWSTFGVPDRIRVPRPAAMIRTVKGWGMAFEGTGGGSGRRTRTSSAGPKNPMGYQLPIPDSYLSVGLRR
jgi:hypothetical protein